MRLPVVVLRLAPCAVAAVIVLPAGGGCALVDQKIPLTYSHPPPPSPQRSATVANAARSGSGDVKLSSNPGPAAASGSITIAIARPAEPTLQKNGSNKPIIGTVRNSYGMETATSVTEASIGEWIANAFAAELNAAGYTAHVVDKLPPGCAHGLELDITRIWVDQDPGWWTVGGLGDVQFKLTIVRNGQGVEQLELTGKGQHRGAFGDTNPKSRALEKALRESIRTAVPYIAAATAAKG